MAILKKRFVIAFITILLSMVFAVNIGWTFALPDYQKVVIGQAETDGGELYTYLNDVVVNNSTTASPIAFTNGTVEREINFDYSFSEDTDIAIKYHLKYATGEDATNVKLNIVSRDDYLLDTTQVQPLTKTYYDGFSSTGTLYYLPSISAGTGTHKIISSVTFYDDNNEISTYYASENVTLKQTNYALNTVYSGVEFEYTHQDIARYWTANSYIKDGTIITASDYKALSSAEQAGYSINEYVAVDGYTVSTGASGYTSVSAGQLISASNYENYLSAGDSNWTVSYYCIEAVGSYSVGDIITSSVYNGLNATTQSNFIVQYTCNTAYLVQGASTEQVSKNTEISAEEFASLFVLEQRYFLPKAHTSYENKRLQIQVEVYTKLSATGANQEAETYYTNKHYFNALGQTADTTAFDNWINYKANATVATDSLMIYNSHGSFDKGIAYNYDFANGTVYGNNISSNITTAYIYTQTGSEETLKFNTRAGGNQSYAGVGVYYMTTSAQTLSFSIGANWYNARGELLSSMPVANINLVENSDFSETSSGSGVYTFNYYLPEKSYGYIDLLEYIEITTKNELFNLDGCRVVINSVTVEFKTIAGTKLTKQAVTAENSTSTNAILYKRASLGYTNTIDARININNDSDQPVKVTSITLTPKFVAYNGQTSEFGVAKTKYIQFDGTNTKFLYNSSMWTIAPSTSTDASNNTVYTYTFSMNSNYYIAPHSSINLIEGVEIYAQSSSGWEINVDATNNITYYADYWFSIDNGTISTSTVSTVSSGTITTKEIISDLVSGSLANGETSYIAYQNKTSQIVTSVTLTFSLYDVSNSLNSFSYNLLNYVTNATTSYTEETTSKSFTFTNINLLPGESVIFCKITSTNSNAISLKSYSVSATLSTEQTSTSIYFKRNAICGNYSVINPTDTSSDLSLTITNFAGKSASGISVNGASYWTISSNNYTYDQKIRPGQLINIISDYNAEMLKATIS